MELLPPFTPAPSPVPSEELVRRIASGGPAVVALSGGVDSAVVAHLAFAALGETAHALTLVGPAVSADEVTRASRVAAAIGIDHHLLRSDPLELPEYRANPSNRCYFCRRSETSALRQWGVGRSVAQWLDGVHLDDLSDDRPGLAAMNEAGFSHPLATAAWGKVDVRSYARSAGLPNWDAPSDACLASRVAHGRPISLPLLRQIERAEAGLRRLGFRRVRVRTDGTSARIQVGADELDRLGDPAEALQVIAVVRREGFDPVVVDPNGYPARPGA
ncbi:MAG: ATP-dependent sacrificial sulfur transferase LarE [Thermoplasmata archaeon]|nr:ATP-dependent sacrificial sulfur transferase LarE [Thermoplasmata archaeon]